MALKDLCAIFDYWNSTITKDLLAFREDLGHIFYYS